MDYSIVIEHLSGITTLVTHQPELTIAQIKHYLGQRWQTPADQINLIFHRRYLHDYQTLTECGIKVGATLQTTLKMTNGFPVNVHLQDEETQVLVILDAPVSSLIAQLKLEPLEFAIYTDMGIMLRSDEFCAHVLHELQRGVTVGKIF